jgi:hypothetical protein
MNKPARPSKDWRKRGRARWTRKSQLVRDIRGAATVSKRKGLKVSLPVLKCQGENYRDRD